MKTKIKEVYYCEFCKKHGLSKHKMQYHEKICYKNPENKRACYDCEILRKKNANIVFDNYDGSIRTTLMEVLYCEKRDIYLYPPKVTHKGNALELDKENIEMPRECEHQKKYDKL